MSHVLQKQSTDPVYKIVQAVSEHEGEDPLVLPPLRNSVDPEALTRIVESGDEALRIAFSYCGYEVSIAGDGSVTVEA